MQLTFSQFGTLRTVTRESGKVSDFYRLQKADGEKIVGIRRIVKTIGRITETSDPTIPVGGSMTAELDIPIDGVDLACNAGELLASLPELGSLQLAETVWAFLRGNVSL